MLIFIENTPRAYAWGSTSALADMLGTAPTGEPQAELWLGAHPGAPASVAKATPTACTLIDLIESDPERYGYRGGQLPFLLKVLAIGAPLSLQVHPNREQAAAGFAAEEAAGVVWGSRERNYGDPRHKPELLVAVSRMRALAGFRPLSEVLADVAGLAGAVRARGDVAGVEAFGVVAARLEASDVAGHGRVRGEFIRWVCGGDPAVSGALGALERLIVCGGVGEGVFAPDCERMGVLGELVSHYPGDPGVLVSLLLHVVCLEPGEAVFLEPGQLHAYVGGVGVEVMAASDNVLRAGLTEKHVDVAELCRVLDTGELSEPRFVGEQLEPGLVAWRPDVCDFQLLRARVCGVDDGVELSRNLDCGCELVIEAKYPLVLIVTEGRVRLDRVQGVSGEYLAEVVSVRRGQSVYVSAGDPVRLTGDGEVFLATVGECCDGDVATPPAP